MSNLPSDDVITWNIGDMLMRWSYDQLPSNFHRVKNPEADEYQGARYSLAFFCQANEDVLMNAHKKISSNYNEEISKTTHQCEF